MKPAEDDVKTMQPLRPCKRQGPQLPGQKVPACSCLADESAVEVVGEVNVCSEIAVEVCEVRLHPVLLEESLSHLSQCMQPCRTSRSGSGL